MLTHESETHRATVDDRGLLKVWELKPKGITWTCYANGNVTESNITEATAPDESLRRLISALGSMPWFAATYSKADKAWWCDVDAGFQRWSGMQSGKVIAKALTQAGFGAEERRMLVRACRRHDWGYCPRQG